MPSRNRGPCSGLFGRGFFALAFGNLLYNGFFHSYGQSINQVSQLITGNNPPMDSPATYFVSGAGSARRNARIDILNQMCQSLSQRPR